jgi:type VI secretion system secreted protein VgrG
VGALFGSRDEIRCTLKIEGFTDRLAILAFHGEEMLSGSTEYVVTVASTDDVADTLDSILGREVLFAIERVEDADSLHVMRGIVREVCPAGITVGREQRHTEITIMPSIGELEYVRGCRVFQNVTVVDIAQELFRVWQIELDVRLHPMPLKREYCTQVNETDYEFLARILSEEGIHFCVEHGKEKSVVVLVNDAVNAAPIVGGESLPFRDAGGAVTTDHVNGIRRERRVRAGSVSQRDYNPLQPRRPMEVTVETSTPNESGTFAAREFYRYPGEYNDPSAESIALGPNVQGATKSGADRSQMRLEEQRSDAFTFSGTSNCLRFRAGRTFEITDHPDRPFNRKYLITRVTIGGQTGQSAELERADRSSGRGLTVRFWAVPAEVRIRPHVLPKPSAHLRIARVVGPKQDEPYVDEYGRIKIQFEWDRQGKHDDKSSCWVRMATPSAHGNQGTYVAHRVGAEVVVDFVDGDVDRPLVIGAVYNGENRQPQALPNDATRAVLYRGLSVPGNKGQNEISCEDRAGNEEILVHAQRDLIERVHRNHTETVSANQTTSVGANQTVSVGANQTISAGANRTVSVGGDENIAIKNSRHETVDDGESVTVTGGRSHTVASKDDALTVAAGNRSVDVKEMHKLTAKEKVEEIATTIDVNAGTSIKIHHKGDSTLELKAGEATLGTATKIVLSNPSGTITLADGKVQLGAAEEIALSVGGAKLSLKKDGTLTLSGSKEVGIDSGGSSLKLAPQQAVVNGSAVNVTASGMMELSGAIIKIN